MESELQKTDCSNNPNNRLKGQIGNINSGFFTSGNINIPQHKCEELCRHLKKCTGFNFAPGDKRCYALNGCENPVTNPGFRLYDIEGNLSIKSW